MALAELTSKPILVLLDAEFFPPKIRTLLCQWYLTTKAFESLISE